MKLTKTDVSGIYFVAEESTSYASVEFVLEDDSDDGNGSPWLNSSVRVNVAFSGTGNDTIAQTTEKAIDRAKNALRASLEIK